MVKNGFFDLLIHPGSRICCYFPASHLDICPLPVEPKNLDWIMPEVQVMPTRSLSENAVLVVSNHALA